MRWEWTALAKEARKARNARRGEVDGKSVKKGQHQNQNPTPSKDAVCRHCSTKGHLSTECWSNPKNLSGSELETKEAKQNRRAAQEREQTR